MNINVCTCFVIICNYYRVYRLITVIITLVIGTIVSSLNLGVSVTNAMQSIRQVLLGHDFCTLISVKSHTFVTSSVLY